MSEAWNRGSDHRWREFRAALIRGWGRVGRTTCEVSGPKCTRALDDVDHIVPLSMGGAKYDPNNCRPSCKPCNRGRRPGPEHEPPFRKVSSW